LSWLRGIGPAELLPLGWSQFSAGVSFQGSKSSVRALESLIQVKVLYRRFLVSKQHPPSKLSHDEDRERRAAYPCVDDFPICGQSHKGLQVVEARSGDGARLFILPSSGENLDPIDRVCCGWEVSMQSEVQVNRRDFLYVATGTTAVVGAGFASWPFIDIDLSGIEEGMSVTVPRRCRSAPGARHDAGRRRPPERPGVTLPVAR